MIPGGEFKLGLVGDSSLSWTLAQNPPDPVNDPSNTVGGLGLSFSAGLPVTFTTSSERYRLTLNDKFGLAAAPQNTFTRGFGQSASVAETDGATSSANIKAFNLSGAVLAFGNGAWFADPKTPVLVLSGVATVTVGPLVSARPAFGDVATEHLQVGGRDSLQGSLAGARGEFKLAHTRVKEVVVGGQVGTKKATIGQVASASATDDTAGNQLIKFEGRGTAAFGKTKIAIVPGLLTAAVDLAWMANGKESFTETQLVTTAAGLSASLMSGRLTLAAQGGPSFFFNPAGQEDVVSWHVAALGSFAVIPDVLAIALNGMLQRKTFGHQYDFGGYSDDAPVAVARRHGLGAPAPSDNPEEDPVGSDLGSLATETRGRTLAEIVLAAPLTVGLVVVKPYVDFVITDDPRTGLGPSLATIGGVAAEFEF